MAFRLSDQTDRMAELNRLIASGGYQQRVQRGAAKKDRLDEIAARMRARGAANIARRVAMREIWAQRQIARCEARSPKAQSEEGDKGSGRLSTEETR